MINNQNIDKQIEVIKKFNRNKERYKYKNNKNNINANNIINKTNKIPLIYKKQ
ncbi:MAG: hypothetical protein ACP5UN_03420 [Candidatus Micrarchaeia archaeon]